MKKILVVDDEMQITKLVQMFLESKEDGNGSKVYDVKTFSGANPCIEYLKADSNSSSGPSVDLILSDVRMPDGDGKDLLDFLNSEKMNVPLFFMTGFSGDLNHEELIGLGAKKIFSKPFKCKTLVEELESFLNTGEVK